MMNVALRTTRCDYLSYTLALLSIATIWAIPLSVFLAMGAVYRTRSTTGWARRLSVVAAVLCSAYTVVVAAMIFYLTFQLLTGQVHT